MQIAPTMNAPTFATGERIATLGYMTDDARPSLYAGASATPPSLYPTREAAFASAYQASFGADLPAMLIGRGPMGFFVQPALVGTGDFTTSVGLAFEGNVGAMPYLVGRPSASLVAIIDGASIITPRN